MNKFFVILFFVISFSIVKGADTYEEVIYDFSNNWLVYDQNYETYIPIKNNQLVAHKVASQQLNLKKYESYFFKFESNKGLSVFVNNKLIYRNVSGKKEVVKIPINEFLNEIQTKEALITFFNKDKQLPTDVIIADVKKEKILTSQKVLESTLPLYYRSINKTDKLMPLFLLIIFMGVFMKQIYPKEFSGFFMLHINGNNEFIQPKALNIPDLWISFINGFAITLIVYLFRFNEIIYRPEWGIAQATFFTVLFYYLFFIGKFIYLLFVGWLFNFSKQVAVQLSSFFRFIERSVLIMAIVLFGIYASGFVHLNLKPDVLYYSLIIIITLAVINVIFLFFRIITFRNLYLISYLCVAEVLPLIILVKVVLF